MLCWEDKPPLAVSPQVTHHSQMVLQAQLGDILVL